MNLVVRVACRREYKRRKKADIKERILPDCAGDYLFKDFSYLRKIILSGFNTIFRWEKVYSEKGSPYNSARFVLPNFFIP